MRSNRGITLVALVITIIVLLILAGVSISLVVGDNGVLTKSTESVIKNREGKVKEEVAMVWASLETEYITAWAQNTAAQKSNYFTINNFNKYLPDNKRVTDFNYNPEGLSRLTYINSEDNSIYYLNVDSLGNVDFVGNASTITKNDYGKVVSYEITYNDQSNYGEGKWEIFYADNYNVYLITRGFLATSGLGMSYGSGANQFSYSGSSDFTNAMYLERFPAVKDGWLYKTYNPNATGTESDPKLRYSSSNGNMKATENLLDKNKWGTYANSSYAEWAIGGPTMELLVASYNKYKGSSITIADPENLGYAKTINSGLTQGSYLNHYTSTDRNPAFYWIASPSSDNNYERIIVAYENRLGDWGYNIPTPTFRPVVCLKSNVVLTWNETNECYDLSLK